MYMTRQEAYVDLSALGAEGLHWRFVEHGTYAAWFYIAITRSNAGDTSRTMLQTMDPSVLATLICSTSNNFSVTDVTLVTPPYINGTATWLMEKLLEFSQCHNEEHGSVDLYLVPGKHYYTPNIPSNLENIRLEKCIYYNASDL